MIEIVVNGTPYTDFVNASVTMSLETMANDFSFVASAVSDFPPLAQGDAVQITVDSETVLTGYIDEVSGRDTEGDHLITYTGRDRTGDLIDSYINVINDIKPGNNLTLKKLIEKIISHLGQDLSVIDNFSPDPFNQAEDFIAPKAGEKAYDFVSKYAKKRQALLSSDADGNILITQSQPTDSGAVVQSATGANDNNILSQSWTINGSERFNKYIFRGQLSLQSLNDAGDSTPEQVENQHGQVTDSAVRAGRQYVSVEKQSYSDNQLDNRAKWSSQLAKAKSTRFTCVVPGHQMPQGGLWEVNTLVQVNSDRAQITRKMLLNTVTFQQGEGQPTVSSLEFVEKNVYTIDEKLAASKKVGSQLDAFSSLG